MSRLLLAYGTTLLVVLALDALWLGWIARQFYQQSIGHLMADSPKWWAAVLFYPVYAAGLVVFAVAPHWHEPGLLRTMLAGGLFGFFAYATYDLTNYATLRNWPIELAAIDLVWGSSISAVACILAKLMLDRFGAG
jgi:uncharacterized membrane protein